MQPLALVRVADHAHDGLHHLEVLLGAVVGRDQQQDDPDPFAVDRAEVEPFLYLSDRDADLLGVVGPRVRDPDAVADSGGCAPLPLDDLLANRGRLGLRNGLGRGASPSINLPVLGGVLISNV